MCIRDRDTPTAIRIFLRQAIKQKGLPFDVAQTAPNADTRAALEEAERIIQGPNTKRYASIDDLFRELDG